MLAAIRASFSLNSVVRLDDRNIMPFGVHTMELFSVFFVNDGASIFNVSKICIA
jgi:hypothetical protein